ncbi:MAG TPA: hypothetical protein VIZ28_08450 [Chitinophagaceae bacterium]
MKKLLPALCLIVLFSGCKKAIEKKQEDALIKVMTDGQWVITSFVQNGTNITTNFSTYKFQYYSNKTVDAINSGTVEKTGTWDGDAATMTTWASFTGVTAPLSLINGSWHIDDSAWTWVIATQTSGGETKVMRLDKQ